MVRWCNGVNNTSGFTYRPRGDLEPDCHDHDHDHVKSSKEFHRRRHICLKPTAQPPVMELEKAKLFEETGIF